jgi:hypothetical protein
MRKIPVQRWVCSAALVFACCIAVQAQGNQFNTPGNILIADQFNNRIIEVNPNNHRVVWRFGNGSSVAGPHSIVSYLWAARTALFAIRQPRHGD